MANSLIRVYWKKSIVAFVTLFLILGNSVDMTTSDYTIKMDSEGPRIIPEMPQYIDFIGSGENNTYSLVLRTNVTDPDGIRTVIGSYCNRSEGEWYNITMQLDPEDESGKIYKGIARKYTLTNRNSGVIWDIKFYACDNQGHWSTNVTFQSVNRIWMSEPPPPLPDELVISIIAGASIIVVSVVTIVVRRSCVKIPGP